MLKFDQTCTVRLNVYYWKSPATSLFYKSSDCLKRLLQKSEIWEKTKNWLTGYSLREVNDLKNLYTLIHEVDCTTIHRKNLKELVESYYRKYGSGLDPKDAEVKRRNESLERDGSSWPHGQMQYGDMIVADGEIFILVKTCPACPDGILQMSCVSGAFYEPVRTPRMAS